MRRLTEAELRCFGRDGYLVVRGVVAEPFLAAADDEIDRLLAEEPPDDGATGSHFVVRHPDQLPAARDALFDSGAVEIAGQLTAPDPLALILDHVQVALNLPPFEHRPGGPHLDGHMVLRPGQDTPDSFTLLGGIFLGDETQGDRGNVWVWPGSHLVHGRLLAERGPATLMDTGGHVGLLDDPPPLGEGVPVLAARGDLLLSHYLLGHNTGGNTSSTTRRMLYYRLGTASHRDRWERALTDPFLEFAPVRRLV